MNKFATTALFLLLAGSLAFGETESRDFWQRADDMIDGSLYSEYRLRHRDGESDQDLYEYLTLRVKDIVPGHVSAYLSMRWHEDLDGIGHYGYADDMFLDLDDARDIDDQIYNLWVDIKSEGDAVRLRVGRQYIDEAEWLHLDGAALRVRPARDWELLAFGGRPVTFYSGTSGDWAAGAGATWRYRPTGRGRLLFYHYDQESVDNNRLMLEVWDRFANRLRMHSKFSLLDGDADIFFIEGSLDIHECGIQIDAQYSRLFDTRENEALPWNPLYAALGDLQSYHYGSLRAIKFWGEMWTLSGGVSGKSVDGDDENATNQDYASYDVSLGFHPTPQWDFTLTAMRWEAEGENRLNGFYGDITWRPVREFEISAGAGTVDYVYEYYDDILFQDDYRRTPDARSYYVKARWRPRERLSVGVRAELEDDVDLEDDDGDTFFTLRTSVSVYF